jgi:hypothetical protein
MMRPETDLDIEARRPGFNAILDALRRQYPFKSEDELCALAKEQWSSDHAAPGS